VFFATAHVKIHYLALLLKRAVQVRLKFRYHAPQCLICSFDTAAFPKGGLISYLCTRMADMDYPQSGKNARTALTRLYVYSISQLQKAMGVSPLYPLITLIVAKKSTKYHGNSENHDVSSNSQTGSDLTALRRGPPAIPGPGTSLYRREDSIL
jgi:hypothetical protein